MNPLITREDLAAFIRSELRDLFGTEVTDRGIEIMARFLKDGGVKVG